MRTAAALLVLSVACPVLAADSPAPASAVAATPASDFDRLKSLVGKWDADTDGDGKSDSVFDYVLTAGGSVLVETQFAGSPHEMMTVYHMDGQRLLATHYCMMQNQPRLAWVPSGSADTVALEFVDGTGMESVKDMHMGSERLTFVDKDHVKAEWQGYENRQPSHLAKMSLSRKKA